mmetsp:Transcript_37960/g.79336  ORF Transcript_37960/g.79336 Transcript_37960/m.79336 type:complete len:228 (-) Transcript_37960:13-696(-)
MNPVVPRLYPRQLPLEILKDLLGWVREGVAEEPERDVDLDVHSAEEVPCDVVGGLACFLRLILLLFLEPDDAILCPCYPILPSVRNQDRAVFLGQPLRKEVFHEVAVLAILACRPISVAIVCRDHIMFLHAALPHSHCTSFLRRATHQCWTFRHGLVCVLHHSNRLVDEGTVLELEEWDRPMGIKLQYAIAPILEVRQVNEPLVMPNCGIAHTLLAQSYLHHDRVRS